MWWLLTLLVVTGYFTQFLPKNPMKRYMKSCDRESQNGKVNNQHNCLDISYRPAHLSSYSVSHYDVYNFMHVNGKNSHKWVEYKLSIWLNLSIQLYDVTNKSSMVCNWKYKTSHTKIRPYRFRNSHSLYAASESRLKR